MPPLPIAGTITFTVLHAATASIHGDLYHDLLVTTAVKGTFVDAPTQHRLRIPAHAAPLGITFELGQVIAATFLLGQVTKVVIGDRH